MTNFTENEVSIYDFWSIIAKHKYLFCTIFLVVLIIGTVAIFLKPKHYEYTQNIRIANYYTDNHNVTFEDPNTIISTITTTYLPKTLEQYNSQHPSHPVYLNKNNLSVTNAGGMIILTTRGTVGSEQIYAEIFRSILAQLNKDVDPRVRTTRNYLTNQLTSLEKQLAIQNDLDKSPTTKLNIQTALLEQFMVSNQRDRIAQLTSSLNDIRYELATLQNNHFTSGLIRSVSPVGMSKMVLIILVIMMSAFLSFLIVFMLEYREKYICYVKRSK